MKHSEMRYRRCGSSGLLLPAVSLGLWHNFGSVDSSAGARALALRAWELGITHFDLANNYGPEPGSAEATFGRILREDFAGLRDQLVISTKAGYRMWDGPYGDGGSRKYLLASLDQSLRRLGVEYVDIFYHHRPDPHTPLEETMLALDHAVRQGKALYVGLSNYTADQTREALRILRELRTPCIVHQPKYSMLHRDPEDGLLDLLAGEGIGCVVFSPLAQGLLTDRYRGGIPADSRVAKPHGFLQPDALSDPLRRRIERLAEIAARREQSLAQLAIAWVLRNSAVTSAIIGASRVSQIEDNVAALERHDFSPDELKQIEEILGTKNGG